MIFSPNQLSELKTLSVLCVEDEPDVREWFKLAFSRLVGKVHLAQNGQEGLELFKEHNPDIIFTDIVMPKKNGLEMAKEIHETDHTVPIIVMTAYGDTANLIEAIDIGVASFIFKPLIVEKVMEAFKKSAEQIFMERALQRKTNELIHLVYTDYMTNIPNRLQLLSDIEKEEQPKLLILNIDSFKEINDFYGHKVGDFILTELGSRLTHLLENFTNPKIYKLSADEFAVLLNGAQQDERFEQHVMELIEAISDELFMYEDYEINIGVSIGVSNEKNNIVANADMALKEAKRSRKPFVTYDNSMKILEQYSKNIHWTRKLKDAIAHDRIIAFYQPIVDNNTQKTTKYESLVRLRDETGEAIAPASFLEISKKSRLYPSITKTMVKKSFERFCDLPLEFSINLSVEDILNQNTSDFIFETIRAYQGRVRPVFEILESEGIENYHDVKSFISQAKDLGCKIAIDDFGSGYSNFEHILRLGVDYIKIDASLIKNIDQDRNSQIIVETITKFAKRLNIETVAEFVSSQEVFEKVKELGVDMSQGYYFAEPSASVI